MKVNTPSHLKDELITFHVDGHKCLMTYTDLLEFHTELGAFLSNIMAGNLDIEPIRRETDEKQKNNKDVE